MSGSSTHEPGKTTQYSRYFAQTAIAITKSFHIIVPVYLLTPSAASAAELTQAGPIVRVTLPDAANACASTSLEAMIKVRARCPSLVILHCIYGGGTPVWKCKTSVMSKAGSVLLIPRSEKSPRQGYVGVCRSRVSLCLDRQKWLIAAVDGRQNPNLAIQLLEPGQENAPLDPILMQLRRRSPRG